MTMRELRPDPPGERRAEVHTRAPGKINLVLRCGPLGQDGFHPLLTTFQAVSAYEEVRATLDDELSVRVTGGGADQVPTDGSNLALRAADLLATYTRTSHGAALHIHKELPVAGGMAGGSADAAATLVALDVLWSTGLDRDELAELAGEVGADVPFALLGHTAVGVGRGHLLSPALTQGTFHWALALQTDGLSTPDVYRTFDEMTEDPQTPDAEADRELLTALRAGDAIALGAALHNDLEPAALALRPSLAAPLEIAKEAGALGVVVSGSGPTVAALGRSAQHALAIAAAWTASAAADTVRTVTGPAPGARVVAGPA